MNTDINQTTMRYSHEQKNLSNYSQISSFPFPKKPEKKDGFCILTVLFQMREGSKSES